MILCPLGLAVTASFHGIYPHFLPASIETTNGAFCLNNSTGGIDEVNNMLHLYWSANLPIDIAAVKAIIIDDIRIPVQEALGSVSDYNND